MSKERLKVYLNLDLDFFTPTHTHTYIQYIRIAHVSIHTCMAALMYMVLHSLTHSLTSRTCDFFAVKYHVSAQHEVKCYNITHTHMLQKVYSDACMHTHTHTHTHSRL
jgi:hypothetical protein